MNIFTMAIALGALFPALEIGTLGYLWRNALRSPWWFVALGAIASYVLMAVCLMSALSDIGITGVRSQASQRFLDPVTVRYCWLMLAWLAGSLLILLALRYMLAKK
jgi:hypothetical protein